MEAERNVPSQKYLGKTGLIAFMALLSAFVPLSTDIYLPALPTMARYFNTTEALTNLTLILFFVCLSVSSLIMGPLSDKYGRRPILLAGGILYLIASLLCAVAQSIWMLIGARVLQAIGGSAAGAVTAAIAKDVYQGRKREMVLAIVQSMVLICPAVAPVVGAMLLRLMSWRGVFFTQAFIGLFALAGSLLYRETLCEKQSGTILQTFGRLAAVLRNPRFSSLLIVFSVSGLASMGFISSSSYVYQNGFGLSEQVFSYFFTFNAVGMIAGPTLYILLSRKFSRKAILNAGYAVMAASGLLVCLFGSRGPWYLALLLLLLPATVAVCCMRPPSVNLMLEQQKADAGSASAFIGSCSSVMGSIGMVIVSLPWHNLVVIIGLLYALTGVFCGLAWLLLQRRPFLADIEIAR